MTKNKELQFESNEVKVYVQQLQAENSILRQSNDEKNELLIKLGCPTKATAKRKVFYLQEQIDQLKAENEELKNFHINLVGVKECEIKELVKLKQTLAEIKEIAEGMHDLWINKTPYTDIDNLVVHLLKCELNRIRYKFDDISEVEDDRT